MINSQLRVPPCVSFLFRPVWAFLSIVILSLFPVFVVAEPSVADRVIVEPAEVSPVSDKLVRSPEGEGEEDKKIHINSASAEELSRGLLGVGSAKAKAIVEFRQLYGDFRDIDELIEVKGIGGVIIEKNRSRLAL